jgi:hypothetical protein
MHSPHEQYVGCMCSYPTLAHSTKVMELDIGVLSSSGCGPVKKAANSGDVNANGKPK